MQNDNGGPSTSTADTESSNENKYDKSTQTPNRRIIFGTWNVRSLKGKEEKVVSEIEKEDADVVVLTETKMKISKRYSSTGTKSKKRNSNTGTKSKKSTRDSNKGTKRNKSKEDSSSGTERNESEEDSRTIDEIIESKEDCNSGDKINESEEDSSTGTERNKSKEDSSKPQKKYIGDYTHIYTAVREGHAQAGVSILYKTYGCLLYDWDAISDRIITAKMNIKGQKFIIVGVYGLSDNASEDRKYEFKEKLVNELIKAYALVKENYELIILGDFNSKVGISTSKAVGEFGDEEESENGWRLINLCDEFELKIQNTFFEHEDVHKYTRYAKPSLIDFFITRDNPNLKVHDVIACKWLECNSDHVFVKAIVSIPTEKDKKNANSKTTGITTRDPLDMLFDYLSELKL